jgi:riboflavin biosynthesis pyrimidine reductase
VSQVSTALATQVAGGAAPAGPTALRELLPEPLETIAHGRGRPMPWALAARYGGDLVMPLRTDRPTVVANFVSTIDGVVAFDTDESSGGGEVSGSHEPDRFVMGLLRALADVVVVGAGTVRAAPDHAWTAAHVHPACADIFAAWRERLGLTARHPTTIVVTAGGDLPREHPGLRDASIPVTVVTTVTGARRVRELDFGPNLEIRVAGDAGQVSPQDVLAAADEVGARVVLCEGGPRLLGHVMAAGLLDELFLTIAPQFAGRTHTTPRPGLIEGVAFPVAAAPWARLRSVRASADHLFLRYALAATGRTTAQESPR